VLLTDLLDHMLGLADLPVVFLVPAGEHGVRARVPRYRVVDEALLHLLMERELGAELVPQTAAFVGARPFELLECRFGLDVHLTKELDCVHGGASSGVFSSTLGGAHEPSGCVA